MKAESALTGHLAEVEEEKEKLLRQIEVNNNKRGKLKELINNLDCIAQTDKRIWAQWEALLDLSDQHATDLRVSLSAIPTPTTITQEVQDVIDKWDALLSVTEAKNTELRDLFTAIKGFADATPEDKQQRDAEFWNRVYEGD